LGEQTRVVALEVMSALRWRFRYASLKVRGLQYQGVAKRFSILHWSWWATSCTYSFQELAVVRVFALVSGLGLQF